MTADLHEPERGEQLLETPHLAGALQSDQFKSFLDHVPVAIGVSELRPSERIVYLNKEFERLSGRSESDLTGKLWGSLTGSATASNDHRQLSDAISDDQDYIGAFTIDAASAVSLAKPRRHRQSPLGDPARDPRCGACAIRQARPRDPGACLPAPRQDVQRGRDRGRGQAPLAENG